jgi:phosphoglycolate phosphatase
MRSASRLIVFDFDGTLADTWRDIATALNRALEEAGLSPLRGPEVRRWIGEGVGPLIERCAPRAWSSPKLERLHARFREHYDALCLETTEPYPGIVECLEALAGERLAIASNKPGRFLERVLVGLGLKRYFEVVVPGDALEVRKPDPRVLAHIVRSMPAEVGEVWMVGDSSVDVEMGRAFGARTVGCVWGFRGAEELRSAGAEVLVSSPAELPGALRARG